MKLLSLVIKNFKGIDSLSLQPGGLGLSIYGDNETGKTTIADAYSWLLFGKDSLGRTEFDIKPIKNNAVIPGLMPDVSAVVLYSNKPIELRKTYEEKWVKKRGNTHKTFAGHQTNHYIDQVPVSKTEYEKKIAEIIKDIRVFRLLSDPRYFNIHLSWQERRDLLIEICGNLSDEEIISTNPSLSELPSLLGSRSIPQHEEILKEKRKSLNKDLLPIPARIDELQKGLFNHSADPLKIRQEIAGLEKQLLDNDSQKKILELESELLQIEKLFQEKQQKKILATNAKQREIDEKLSQLYSNLNNKESIISNNETRLEKIDSELALLQAERNKTDKLPPPDDTCPTCGQVLPEETRKKALVNYNIQKAEKLQDIDAQCKALNTEKKSITTQNINTEQEIAGLKKEIQVLENALTEEKNKALSVTNNDPRHQEVVSEIAKLEFSEESSRIEEINEEINKKRTILLEMQQDEKANSRIKELEESEKTLSKKLEQVEYELSLTDLFAQTQARLLETKINSSFEFAEFKLFETQVNGSVVPICKMLHKGVSFGSINNAAEINLGIDIINTFARFYDFAPPIFIDNSEAVTRLAETDSQLIRLVVSAPDKVLRIEPAIEEPDF